MKVSLILSGACIIALAMFSKGNYVTQAHSQITAVHPAIRSLSEYSKPDFSPEPLKVFTSPPLQALASGDPEPPRVYLNTAYVAPTGRSINVNAGGNLQSALDQALPGDVIVIQAGATFTGNFTLPNKSGTGWITVRTSTPDTNL